MCQNTQYIHSTKFCKFQIIHANFFFIKESKLSKLKNSEKLVVFYGTISELASKGKKKINGGGLYEK